MTKQGEFLTWPLVDLYAKTNSFNFFQRTLNPIKVQQIKDALIAERNRIGYIVQTGVIHVVKFNNEHLILDGQHRLSAYKEIGQPENLIVQLWYYNTHPEMLQKFIDINNNTPIEEFVRNAAVNTINPNSTPNNGISITMEDKQKYDMLIKYIQIKYKSLLKTSNKPQWPNINIDQFRQVVHKIPELQDAILDNIVVKFEELNNKCRMDMAAGSQQEKEWIRKTDNEDLPKLYINRYLIDLWKNRDN